MRILLLLVLTTTAAGLAAQVDTVVPAITCWSRDTVEGITLPAPASVVDGTAAMNTVFDLVFTDSVPAEAKASIQFAADIWGSYLQSEVPIRVEVDWQDKNDDRILASAGPSAIYRAFRGAVDPQVWYPVALAEAIVGEDLNDADDPDIVVQVNSTANWNFATEGSVPRNKIDLSSVILHEFGHGLGFLSSIDSTSDSTLSIGFDQRFIIYDLFLETPGGLSLADTAEFKSPSEELLAAVIDRLEFAGDSAVAKNGKELVPLFAPATFDVGSSVSHLDERTYRAGSPNALMTPSIAAGEAARDPGPVTLGILFDLGWPLRFEIVSTRFNVIADRLNIYPNPASDRFTVELEAGAAPVQAVLYAPDGREVRRQAVDPVAGRAEINVDGLAPGIYTLLLPDRDRAWTGRVMVR